MRQSVTLGRIGGVLIGANWSVPVMGALIAFVLAAVVLPTTVPGHSPAFYWTVAVSGAVAFLASLLAHELAHAAVARRHGARVRSVTLWMLGGTTRLEGEPADPRTDLAVAVAGPLTSVLIGLLLLGAGIGVRLFGRVAVVDAIATASFWIGAMNVLLAWFNLLPGASLDGGRILRAAIWWLRGDPAAAERAATLAGRVAGGTLVVAGVAMIVLSGRFDGLWLALVGWFLARSAGVEQRADRVRTLLGGVRVGEVMTPDPVVAPAWVSVERFISEIARAARQSVFPVVALDGMPTGVVTLDLLLDAARHRHGDRVQAVAHDLPGAYVAAPDEPVAPLLGRAALAGQLLAVVVSGGHVVGMIATDDLNRFVHLRSVLRARASAEDVPEPAASAGCRA